MIPRGDIVGWRSEAPWVSDAQVEQDLIICRAVVALYSNPKIANGLAFRGGTALHKLFLPPPSRYSEDIDLVQTQPVPVGYMLDAVHAALDGFLGAPRYKQTAGGATLTYRVESELPPIMPIRLKVEINTREHFSVLGFARQPFSVHTRWFTGRCDTVTYALDELLGTKLRALYQRRKGRDLFDLWLGLTAGNASPKAIVQTFHRYMDAEGSAVTRRQFEKNMAAKIEHKTFLADTDALIRPTISYDPALAYELVCNKVIALLD